MSLSEIDQVRLKIHDQSKATAATLYGLGSGLTIYSLAQRNVSSGTAYIMGGNGFSATGAAFNASGWIEFAQPISAGTPILARYVFSTFSDTEIQHFLDVGGGGVVGAALEAVVSLMFDSLRRAQWSAPDGSSYDDTAAMGLLDKLYRLLSDVLNAEQAADGGSFHAWAETQSE